MAAARCLRAAWCGRATLPGLLPSTAAVSRSPPLAGDRRPRWAPATGAAAHAAAAAGSAPAAAASPEATGVYSSPELYDIAFGFRDFEKEVAFLRAAYAAHASPAGAPLARWLELGCGARCVRQA